MTGGPDLRPPTEAVRRALHRVAFVLGRIAGLPDAEIFAMFEKGEKDKTYTLQMPPLKHANVPEPKKKGARARRPR